MVEQKDLELTSSHKHTKITTIYRTTINEKDWNLPENIFYNKDVKMEPQDEQEGQTCD